MLSAQREHDLKVYKAKLIAKFNDEIETMKIVKAGSKRPRLD